MRRARRPPRRRPSDYLAARISASVTAPSRRMRGGFTVQSRTVDATPLLSSSVSSGTTTPTHAARTGSSASKAPGACRPEMFADVVASGQPTVVGHAQADGARRRAEGRGHGVARFHDERKRSRPVRSCQTSGQVGHVRSVAVEVVDAAHEPGDGLAAVALLQIVERLGARRRLDGHAQAVHRLGGKDDRLAALEGGDGFALRAGQWRHGSSLLR